MGTSFYDNAMFRNPVFERNPRKGSFQPTFLMHRFPIKGGLSFREVLQSSNRNKLLDLVSVTQEQLR